MLKRENVEATDVLLEISKKLKQTQIKMLKKHIFIITIKNLVTVNFLNSKFKSKLMNEKSKMKNIDELTGVYVNDFLSRESIKVI